MLFTPESVVYLCDTLLENDNENQLYFANRSQQEEYFLGTVVQTFQNFTYLRQGGIISVPVCKEDLYNCNYVMYKNSNFGNKWFYAFIDKLEYKNPTCTHIHISTDFWQTWCFDISFKQSWVERMHEKIDTIGYNTMPEPVNIGYQRVEQSTHLWRATTYAIIVQSAVDLSKPVGDDGYPRVQGTTYNGVYQGSALFGWHRTEEGIANLNLILNSAAGRGQANSITAIYMVPSVVVGNFTDGHKIVNLTDIYMGTLHSTIKHGTFGGYVPKNNKLYTYPYSYTLLSNNNGQTLELHNECFNGQPEYTLTADCSSNCNIELMPTNYFSDNINLFKLSIQNTPMCSWNYDSYTAWVGVHGEAIGWNLLGSALSSVTGALTNMASGGDFSLNAGGVIGSVTSAIGQYATAKHLPDVEQGTATGQFLVGAHRMGFRQYTVCCRYEFAKEIDDFFSRFGYAVNQLHDIELGTRQNWNYIKTSEINIVGAIPQDDLINIKKMFNSGITFWNNPDTFGDYSKSNLPVVSA